MQLCSPDGKLTRWEQRRHFLLLLSCDRYGRVGQVLADECCSRGVHCALGQTTNVQRNPRGGYDFESYSEGELC